MNLIENLADNNFEIWLRKISIPPKPEKAISFLSEKLNSYNKPIYKIVYLNRYILNVRKQLEEHSKTCKVIENCTKELFYENLIFFLNEEIEYFEGLVENRYFNRQERIEISQIEKKIFDELTKLSIGQELTYDDLIAELKDIKELLFLNKKNWINIFSGKLLEMLAGGVIEEATASTILNTVKITYANIFGK